MNTLSQTRRIARPLSYLTTVALIAYPLTLLVFALSGGVDLAHLRATHDVQMPEGLPTASWITVYAIGTLSLALTVLILWHIRALLSQFAMGDVLSTDAALRIRSIGTLLLVKATYGVVAHTLTILALTAGNPPGARSLAIGVSKTDLFLFLAAGLMTVIGLAMSEAARVADENRAFV